MSQSEADGKFESYQDDSDSQSNSIVEEKLIGSEIQGIIDALKHSTDKLETGNLREAQEMEQS